MQWWTSLTSSPKRGSFYLSSPDPTQLSHSCQTHSTETRVPLSILTRPALAGGLQVQVLSHMGLQNLNAEVDPSLEPGSDHRASENPQGCCRLQTHGRFHAPVLRPQTKQSSYKQQLGPSSKLSWYNCPSNTTEYPPKTAWAAVLCPVTVFFQLFHWAVKIVPKDVTMKNHPKSLLCCL